MGSYSGVDGNVAMGLYGVGGEGFLMCFMVLTPMAMELYGVVDGNGFLIGFMVLTAMWQWDFMVLLTEMGFQWVFNGFLMGF